MYAIILAAGTASRMNEAKLLLKYKDESILSHMVNSILEAKLIPIIVTGCYKDLMDKEIINIEKKLNTSIYTVFNENYKSGQLSSLIKGVKYYEEIITKEKCVNEPYFITVGDLPLIKGYHYLNLIEEIGNHDAIRPYVNNTYGHPVLIQNKLNDKIISLDSNNKKEGLKSFLRSVDTLKYESSDIAYISDIDTKENYYSLTKNS